MRLSFSVVAALAFITLSAGCSTTAIIIPTAGPLATSGAPEIKATISGIAGRNGEFDFVMPDGEIVKGHWQSVRTGRGTSSGAGTARGNRGTVFDLEFIADGSAHGVGTASDNKGNRYRVLVRGI